MKPLLRKWLRYRERHFGNLPESEITLRQMTFYQGAMTAIELLALAERDGEDFHTLIADMIDDATDFNQIILAETNR